MRESGINQFQKLLKIRAAFKAVSQLSWSVSQLEKHYPLDMLSEDGIQQLLLAYVGFSKELKAIGDELEGAINNDQENKTD